jgi:hypothetical protein
MHPRDPNTLAFTPQDMTSDDANKYGLYQGEASVRYSNKDVPLNFGYLSMIRAQHS